MERPRFQPDRLSRFQGKSLPYQASLAVELPQADIVGKVQLDPVLVQQEKMCLAVQSQHANLASLREVSRARLFLAIARNRILIKAKVVTIGLRIELGNGIAQFIRLKGSGSHVDPSLVERA